MMAIDISGDVFLHDVAQGTRPEDTKILTKTIRIPKYIGRVDQPPGLWR